jgi:hypothetical protein
MSRGASARAPWAGGQEKGRAMVCDGTRRLRCFHESSAAMSRVSLHCRLAVAIVDARSSPTRVTALNSE